MDSSESSWQALKRVGNDHFQRGNFNEALQAYRRSLLDTRLVDKIDRSLILSNMVACRLQLGGPVHAKAAVQDARECIKLNPNWSKGYLRLGSALSASGDSNEACNALQTCLRMDPKCQAARQMLMRELRRDHGSAPTTGNASGSDIDTDAKESSSSQTRPPPLNPNYQAPQQEQEQPSYPNNSQPQRQAAIHDIDIDEQLPLIERVGLAASRLLNKLSEAYHSQPETSRSLVKVAVVLTVLYVAFGGRFGLEYLSGNTTERMGRYETANAYSSTHRNQAQTGYSSAKNYDSHHRSSSSYSRPHSSTNDDYSTYSTTTNSKRGGSNWWNWGRSTNRNSNKGWRESNSSTYNNGGSLTSGFSLSWLMGAGMVYFLYRQHGLYAAAMFVVNQYRLRNMRQHHGGIGWGGGGGGMYGAGGGIFGRPQRGRGWW
ncbi:hypothetical protein MPSEU_000643200 [Mayamaea pseudoterrestris]|nr:hypothetical protein MPSEU_000643200 [Mayamaea pseudoterrestris]